ncbi:MAG TPA: MerR family transcriptional regulator [Candidatus Sulfotelmatobacter sp.]|nr:MerR family transcriptional regulator [Candidatus Sulfotelmatobacter sp.]
MAQLTISQVARQIGLRPSAIRYYERIGLLPRPQRLSGQRRYDATVLYRLAIIQRARQLGFTLGEIRHLFFGFRDVTQASERWRTLSQRKLRELDQLLEGIKAVQGLLRRLMSNCRCETLDQCGKGIFQSMGRKVISEPIFRNIRGQEKLQRNLTQIESRSHRIP